MANRSAYQQFPTHGRVSPKTAFIVAGECRASPALLRSSHEVVSTRLQLTSYRDFVLRPWGSTDSHVFLLVACESHPLGDLCDIFAGTRCSQLRLDAPQPVPPKHPKCFEHFSSLGGNASRSDETELDGARSLTTSRAARTDYTGYPIWWRRMADSWDAVREEERRSGQTFGTFLFSRTDLVFIRPMGAWAHYVHEPGTSQPWYWHSAGTGTPDILDHVPRRGAPRPRSKLERVPRMHNNRALLQSSNVGVLLVDPSLLVSCEGLLPVRPTPWERDGLGKPESFALSNQWHWT